MRHRILSFRPSWRLCHKSKVEARPLAIRDSGVYCVLARTLQPSPLKRHSNFVISPAPWQPGRGKPAFTLIEMVTVIAVLVILMTAGLSMLNGNSSQARKTGTDLITGMIDQARSTAITSRSNVILAMAAPGALPTQDQNYRLALFKVDVEDWKKSSGGTVSGELLSRWRPLETGAILLGGEVDGVSNAIDGDELTINYGKNKPLSVKVRALVFNPRGGLLFPSGSTPVSLRIAEGTYRNGMALPYKRGDNAAITENRLKIGRITARPYQTN